MSGVAVEIGNLTVKVRVKVPKPPVSRLPKGAGSGPGGQQKSGRLWFGDNLFVFYFNHLETPTWIYPENFMKIRLDLAEIYRILKMFICLFVCLFVCWPVCFFILIFLGHPHEYTLKISQGPDLIWLRYSESKTCLFVCMFVRLFIDLFFILIFLEHPQKYTLKILWRSDLIWLRCLGSKKCLFVCLFVCWSFLF